ncbi:MAG TPA: glucosamine-6-phosphate deaminase, partial [Candidatus Woesebacteria bacterium]|nr:glucosamine-6-phosphate deaminase [Candidatus Woesebacteria bacterium]
MVDTVYKYDSYDSMSRAVAEKIKTHIILQPKFNLGLATGSSAKGVYKELIFQLSGSSIDLSNLHTFNLDEYYPIKQTDLHSYYQEMKDCFWDPLQNANTSFNPKHGHMLNGEAKNASLECKNYEELIFHSGGIDIQILGLGVNGHIAFNEPGSDSKSRTRKIEIAEATRESNSKYFGDDIQKVPQFGLTMGIGTILESKKIYLIVTGDAKISVFRS